MIFGSGPAQQYHERWFRQELIDVNDVGLRVCGNELTGLSIAGPNARAVLDGLTDFDVSNEALRFLDLRDTWVGACRRCRAGHLHRRPRLRDLVCSELPAATVRRADGGRSTHGIRLFGVRALDSMRLDKGWGSWATEYRPIYDPYEANMGWMVKLDKGFIGRDAAAAAKTAGAARKLVVFSMDAGTGDDAADCIGNEPIWHDGGGGRLGHLGRLRPPHGRSIAMGYVPTEHATSDGPWEIEVVGVMRSASRRRSAVRSRRVAHAFLTGQPWTVIELSALIIAVATEGAQVEVQPGVPSRHLQRLGVVVVAALRPPRSARPSCGRPHRRS